MLNRHLISINPKHTNKHISKHIPMLKITQHTIKKTESQHDKVTVIILINGCVVKGAAI